MSEFYMILARKIIKIYTRIFMIFARKMNKIPEFYTIFDRKMLELYIIIGRKIFSRILGGTCPPPVSYAHKQMGTWSISSRGGTKVGSSPYSSTRTLPRYMQQVW